MNRLTSSSLDAAHCDIEVPAATPSCGETSKVSALSVDSDNGTANLEDTVPEVVSDSECVADEGEEDSGCAEADEEQVEGQEGEEGDDTAYNYDPLESNANPTKRRDPLNDFVVGGRHYSRKGLVSNKGLLAAERRLRGNPMATFSACGINTRHNVLECNGLHFSNRGVLVGDRYIRVNMLVDNAAKSTLLSNATAALRMTFCQAAHDPAECDRLHLLPGVVFIGIPGLRTGYFVAELHDNMGLQKLRVVSFGEQCGSWCKSAHSHAILTCRNLHYKRSTAHREKPNPPSRPLALIPDLTPRRPPQEHDTAPSHGRRRGRGRGRRGGRGGRGLHSVHVPLPESLRPRRPPVATQDLAATASPYIVEENLVDADHCRDDESPADNSRLLSVLFVLLGLVLLLAALLLSGL